MKNQKNEKNKANIYEQLEILALHSVSVGRDTSYIYRKICRWFSVRFNTPLLSVVNLSVEFVLQHYYEDTFENLKEEELTNMMRHHADPDYVKESEKDDDEFFRQMEEEIQERERAKELKLKKKEPEKQSSKEDEISVKFDDLDIKNET